MLNRHAPLRDYRAPRDWLRPWRDPPGFLLPNCPCCGSGGARLYTLGGVSNASFPAGVANVDKTDFATETTAAASSANLTGNRANAGSAVNPGVAGYVAGGRANLAVAADLAAVDKTQFATDTTAAVGPASLSQAREELCGLSERQTKAYFAGGGRDVAGILTAVTTADRLTFATDTTSGVASAALSSARKFPAGMTGDATKGYWAGGAPGSASSAVAVTEKLLFSTEISAAVFPASLSVARFGLFAGSDGTDKGYWAGGQSGLTVSTVDKTAFASDTTVALSATMARTQGSSGSDGNKLLLLGGSLSDPSGSKLIFATDTAAALGIAGNLSLARQLCTGFSTVGL